MIPCQVRTCVTLKIQVGEEPHEEQSYRGAPQQPSGRAQGHYQGHMGSFNPITGQWAEEPNHPDRAR